MVEIGTVIPARVVRLEPYGIFLKYGDEDVCVLIPEMSWSPVSHPAEMVREGDLLDVYVLRYNYRDKVIVGSLRRLHPEQNPYRALARLEPGTVLRGKVRTTYGDAVTVSLPNQTWGYIPKNRLRTALNPGDGVEVTISSLEVDEGRLWFDLVRRVAGLAALPAVPSVLATQPQETA